MTDIRVSWAEFDVDNKPISIVVGWAEFDVSSPTGDPIPPYEPGIGMGRYRRDDDDKYDVLVDSEGEDEEIVMAILMEISAHVL